MSGLGISSVALGVGFGCVRPVQNSSGFYKADTSVSPNSSERAGWTGPGTQVPSVLLALLSTECHSHLVIQHGSPPRTHSKE